MHFSWFCKYKKSIQHDLIFIFLVLSEYINIFVQKHFLHEMRDCMRMRNINGNNLEQNVLIQLPLIKNQNSEGYFSTDIQKFPKGYLLLKNYVRQIISLLNEKINRELGFRKMASRDRRALFYFYENQAAAYCKDQCKNQAFIRYIFLQSYKCKNKDNLQYRTNIQIYIFKTMCIRNLNSFEGSELDAGQKSVLKICDCCMYLSVSGEETTISYITSSNMNHTKAPPSSKFIF